MLDVHFPATDGRTLVLSRCTELNADQKLLVRQLNLELPPQTPTTDHRRRPHRSGACPRRVAKTFALISNSVGMDPGAHYPGVRDRVC